MRRHRIVFAVVAATSMSAGCRASTVPERRPSEVLAAGAGDGGAPDGAEGPGLPCDVAQVLTRCTSCHSAHPTSAPMSLVAWADLVAPATTDPSKRVVDLVASRIRSTTDPMPPSSPLVAEEIDTLTRWIERGAPRESCVAVETRTPSVGLPECVLASDCPGELVCRNGVCDIECATSKDCASGWSCERTRCQPPPGPAIDAGPVTAYEDLGTKGAWTTAAVPVPGDVAYSGAVFDGRYVYFAPDGASGKVLRFDTRLAFGATRAWSTYELTLRNPLAKTYRGTVFDGRYVYFVPNGAGATLARFDTQASFLDDAAWTLFDLKAVNASVGFTGGVFDGRYVYLVPTWSSGAVAFRYDTQGPLSQLASWSVFSIATLGPSARFFVGAVFDGRYVYYLPNGAGAGPFGTVARYDVEAPFGQASSWATVDLGALEPRAVGYRSGAFDGRYLYLVPGWSAPTPNWSGSMVARYDTQAAFAAGASWEFFDMAAFDPGASGFNAAVFDGRRVVFAPGYDGGSYHGVTVAFDTRKSLADLKAWSAFDLGTLAQPVANVRGASFDGRYVYFAPRAGTAVRFDARPVTANPAPLGASSFY